MSTYMPRHTSACGSSNQPHAMAVVHCANFCLESPGVQGTRRDLLAPTLPRAETLSCLISTIHSERFLPVSFQSGVASIQFGKLKYERWLSFDELGSNRPHGKHLTKPVTTLRALFTKRLQCWRLGQNARTAQRT